MKELDESSTDAGAEASSEEQDAQAEPAQEEQQAALGIGEGTLPQGPQGAEVAEEVETEPSRVPCPECGESYANERGLAVHMARKHGKKRKIKEKVAKTKPCPICGKRVAPQGLPNHMRMHEKEKKTEAGSELTALIEGPVSEAVQQILEQIPKIADKLLKNEEMLLQALQNNGWELKVKDEKIIILIKSS